MRVAEVIRKEIGALERETGVLRQSMMKFARGEQVLRGDAYDKLAVYFDLELKPKGKKG